MNSFGWLIKKWSRKLNILNSNLVFYALKQVEKLKQSFEILFKLFCIGL